MPERMKLLGRTKSKRSKHKNKNGKNVGSYYSDTY